MSARGWLAHLPVVDEALDAPSRNWLGAGLAAVVLYLAWQIFIPFFVPLFWGATLAVVFYPLYRRVNRRLHRRRGLSAAALTAGVLLLVLLPAAALAFVAATQAVDLIQRAEQALGLGAALSRGTLLARLFPLLERFGVGQAQVQEAAGEALREAAGLSVTLVSVLLGNVISLALNTFFTLVALYYAFKDGPRFLERVKGLTPLPRAEVEAVFSTLKRVVATSMASTFAVAALQAAVGGVFFWLVGLPDEVFWAAAIFVVSLIPVLGPLAVWIPVAFVLAMFGDYYRAAAIFAFGATVVNVIDNFLRKVIIHHGRVAINNLYLFFGILGGVYLVGFSGLIFGPVVVSLALTIIGLYRKRQALEADKRAPGQSQGMAAR